MKKTKAKMAGGVTQVLEPLLSKYKALNSNPITRLQNKISLKGVRARRP
jgi:hypothetical protein